MLADDPGSRCAARPRSAAARSRCASGTDAASAESSRGRPPTYVRINVPRSITLAIFPAPSRYARRRWPSDRRKRAQDRVGLKPLSKGVYRLGSKVSVSPFRPPSRARRPCRRSERSSPRAFRLYAHPVIGFADQRRAERREERVRPRRRVARNRDDWNDVKGRKFPCIADHCPVDRLLIYGMGSINRRIDRLTETPAASPPSTRRSRHP